MHLLVVAVAIIIAKDIIKMYKSSFANEYIY
jgi:hypothetical protein